MKSRWRNLIVLLVAGLLLVLSAGAGATAALVITGKQIKNGTVTGKDVKNRSLAAKDLSRAAKLKLRGARGPAGAQGPAGAAGLPGLPGVAGLPGLSGFEVVTKTVTIPAATGSVATVTAACGSGQKALAASSSYATLLPGLLSQVTRVDGSTFEATGLNNVLGGITGQVLKLDVVCATIPN